MKNRYKNLLKEMIGEAYRITPTRRDILNRLRATTTGALNNIMSSDAFKNGRTNTRNSVIGLSARQARIDAIQNMGIPDPKRRTGLFKGATDAELKQDMRDTRRTEKAVLALNKKNKK